MRVNIRTSGVIKIGSSIIESITCRSDDIMYADMLLALGVNIPAILEKGGNSLRLSIFNREVSFETKPFAIDVVGDSLVSATTSESMEKDRITKIREELCLYSDVIDITRFIANDQAKSSNFSSKKNTLDVVAVGSSKEFQTGNNLVPVLPDISSDIEELDEQQMRMLVYRGSDPAMASTKFPVQDPGSIRITKNENALRLDSKTKTNPMSVYRRLGQPGVYRTLKYTTDYFQVKHTVSLPFATLTTTPQLFFHIEAIDRLGVTLDYAVSKIETVSIIEDANRQIANSTGSTGVTTTIYTREVQPPRTTRLGYFVPSQLPPLTQSGIIRGNPVIVRRINKRENDFSTSHVGKVFLRKRAIGTDKSKGSDEVPFFLNRKEDNLQAVIPKLPQGIVAVGLQRRDVSRLSGFVNVGAMELVQAGSSVTFTDTGMRDVTTYEYRIKFIDNKSNQRYSTNTCLYRFVSSVLSPSAFLSVANVSTTPAATSIGNVPLVTIQLNSSIADRGIADSDTILAGTGGNRGTLLAEQSLNPGNYSPAMAYYVKRFNIRTGEIENIGIFTDANIVDDSALPNGSAKSATPLSFFEEYRYIISLCLIPPSSLSTNLVTKAVDPSTGRQYTFNSYKFRSRNRFTDLPSSNEMSNLSSRSVLRRNTDSTQVGIECSVKVSFESLMPKVTDIDVRKTYNRSNLVTWRVSGDPRLVDHFQVYAEADGIKALIGCTHAFTNDGTYRYDDTQLYERLGSVTYSVKPVTLDLTRIDSGAYVSIVKDNTLPDYLKV